MKRWLLLPVYALFATASLLLAQTYPGSSNTAGSGGVMAPRGCGSPESVDLSNGLVRYYRMEEPSGGNRVNVLSGADALVPLATVPTGTGKYGNGADTAAGSSAFHQNVSVMFPTNGGTYTVDFWLKAAQFTDFNGGLAPPFPLFGSSNVTGGLDLTVNNTSGNSLKLIVYPTGTLSTNLTVPLTRFAHVTLWFQPGSPGTLGVDVDGDYRTASTTVSFSNTLIEDIGYFANQSGTLGIYDEMGVWSRMLNKCEREARQHGAIYPF